MKAKERVIDDKDKQIISLLRRGMTFKEIASLVYLSIDGVNYRLMAMRRYYNCANNVQLVDFLRDEGLI